MSSCGIVAVAREDDGYVRVLLNECNASKDNTANTIMNRTLNTFEGPALISFVCFNVWDTLHFAQRRTICHICQLTSHVGASHPHVDAGTRVIPTKGTIGRALFQLVLSQESCTEIPHYKHTLWTR